MWNYGLFAGTAAALALVITPPVRWLALRLGAVDEPGGRRAHRGRVPRLGGLAVLLAGLGGLLLPWAGGVPVFAELIGRGWSLGWFLAGMLVVTALGIFDDCRNVGPLPKLVFETLAAIIALAGGVGFVAISNPFTGGSIEIGPLGGVLSVLWIVGITNAFNLIDGLDGLAAGVALIASATIFVIAGVQTRPDAAVLAAVLAGALLGFLRYNFCPASIFLGDSGSLLLGYVLSVLSIQGQQKGPTVVVLLVPILVLGFPIVETLVTVARRYGRGGSASLFDADREHIHHRLVMRGMAQRRAVLLLYGVSGGLGLLAVLAVVVGGPGSAALVLVAAVAGYLGLRRLGYTFVRGGAATHD